MHGLQLVCMELAARARGSPGRTVDPYTRDSDLRHRADSRYVSVVFLPDIGEHYCESH